MPFSHRTTNNFCRNIIPAKILTTDNLNNLDEFLKNIFTNKPNTTLSARNSIITQGFIQTVKAEKEAVSYFLRIDGIVRNLHSKLFNKDRNKTKNS